MQTMYYIGVDVHKRTISSCVKDGSGTIHAEGTNRDTRFDLDHWLRTLPQPKELRMVRLNPGLMLSLLFLLHLLLLDILLLELLRLLLVALFDLLPFCFIGVLLGEALVVLLLFLLEPLELLVLLVIKPLLLFLVFLVQLGIAGVGRSGLLVGRNFLGVSDGVIGTDRVIIGAAIRCRLVASACFPGGNNGGATK